MGHRESIVFTTVQEGRVLRLFGLVFLNACAKVGIPDDISEIVPKGTARTLWSTPSEMIEASGSKA